jgi:hypothetical protein
VAQENLIGSTETRWPDPKRGPWFVVGHWVERNGRPECIGLELWKGAQPGDGALRRLGREVDGIGGLDLRALPLATILDDLWRRGERAHGGAASVRARRSRDDADHFADVAAVYLRGGRRPTMAVKEHFAVPYSTATKWVSRARALGLLESTSKGRANRRRPTKKGTKR